MIREELLAEARRRYPKGTKFRSAMNFKEVIQFANINNIYVNADGNVYNGLNFLYYNGRWAEIIEPVVKNQELFLI